MGNPRRAGVNPHRPAAAHPPPMTPSRPVQRAVIAALFGVLAAASAGGLVALAEPSKAGFSPDPPAHASKKQWLLTIAARAGKVSAESATSSLLTQPAESPRVVGRFALELYVGPELLDRVRFNVPLMGDGPVEHSRKRAYHNPDTDAVTTSLKVRFADSPRAAYLVLVDRFTDERQRFEWPPSADGKLIPWKSGLSDAGPGDFPEGGARVMGKLESGSPAAKDAGARADSSTNGG
jgi:hypothetical protein